MILRLDYYSAYKADERSVRFQLDGSDHMGEKVIDQWQSPGATYFKVHADEGNIYVLRHVLSPQEDAWTLEPISEARTLRLA